jgi:hypothetical protein
MARLIRGRRWGVAERWREIMRSLPSGSWIDLEFAEAACKRIAELETEVEASRRLLAEDQGRRISADKAIEARDRRIAELDAENKQLRDRLEFFEPDEYEQPGMESIQERYRGAGDE